MTHFYNLGITSSTHKNKTAAGLDPDFVFSFFLGISNRTKVWKNMLKKKVCPSSKLLTLIPFKTCDVVSKIMTALFGKSQSYLVILIHSYLTGIN